ncbi:MAG: hypothetical protein WC471_04365 [Candidatus Woesearchaeota archaeon]
MSKITDIRIQTGNKDRISIYVDGKFFKATYITRTPDIERLSGIKLEMGSVIDTKKLSDVIDYVWKLKYKDSWEKEQERKKQVFSLIQDKIKGVTFEDIGFGTDSTKIILKHPIEKGGPDVIMKFGKKTLYLEVTGKIGCGKELWLRPDKIEYMKKHPEMDIWVAHTCDKEKETYFIKIDLKKTYIAEEYEIRGGIEKMVSFDFDDDEVHSVEEFIKYLSK